MKRFLIYFFVSIIIIFSSLIFFLSFYGYQTDRFNKIIQSKINNSKKAINLEFDEISILLDIKNLTLFVKFINPEVQYNSTKIPLEVLRANISVLSLIKNEISIKNVNAETKFFEIDLIKNHVSQIKIDKIYKNYIKKIDTSKIKLKSSFSFDNAFSIKDFTLNGIVKDTNIWSETKYKLSNLNLNFLYKNELININNISAKSDYINIENGKIDITNNKGITNFKLKSKIIFQSNQETLPIINKKFNKGDTFTIKSDLSIKKNKNILIQKLIFSNDNNEFVLDNLILNKSLEFLNFKKLKIKTSNNNKINNDFEILNRKVIIIDGNIFDGRSLIKELNNQENKKNFLSSISKNIEIDFKKVLTSSDIPLNKFRLVGIIKKGKLEKISAKSEFSKNKFLDISIKKENTTGNSILEIYSDEANPLVNGYKFFEGLEGGNLFYLSNSSKEKSIGNLQIENFKINQAPGFAKLLSLADLKGLTDALKGEGISFDKLSIQYEIKNGWMEIKEIFLIGPSISILIDGYFDKRKDILSLRGTLVPAKTLNTLVSKIPVIGDILIGKKTGDGLFGVSFKIKGSTDNLKTSVNPVKTLTPRFITRTLEEYKKKNAK